MDIYYYSNLLATSFFFQTPHLTAHSSSTKQFDSVIDAMMAEDSIPPLQMWSRKLMICLNLTLKSIFMYNGDTFILSSFILVLLRIKIDLVLSSFLCSSIHFYLHWLSIHIL